MLNPEFPAEYTVSLSRTDMNVFGCQKLTDDVKLTEQVEGINKEFGMSKNEALYQKPAVGLDTFRNTFIKLFELELLIGCITYIFVSREELKNGGNE